MKPKPFLFLLISIFSFLGSLKAQTITPYLQGATPNSIIATWKTGATTTQSKVRLGSSAVSLTTVYTGTTQIMTDAGYSNNYYYHNVKIKGLSPNTKYFYRIISGNDSSAVFSFKTLPNPGSAATANGHLRFLFLGDNQLKAQPRYDTLVVQAKRNCEQKFGIPFNDHVTMLLNVGDQVDVGTLDHYENVHLNKSKYISPYLPISTIIGNHETYGTMGLTAYYNHFFYDSLKYNNIYSGSEDYYAMHVGNVLFICMNTENTSSTQFSWVQNVVNQANSDPNVEWIISMAHRPYQAEQYVGDISTWIRNTVVPFLSTSPKYVMHFGAHHHLYARGQIKNAPVYHLISGGTAWDQYWGMGTEQNMDDVQKTISNWGYQIVDVDVVNHSVDVECYSVGSIYKHKNNILIDKFHRVKFKAPPVKPSITNNFGTSISLPYTISSSSFSTSTTELLNTTEFQIATNKLFSMPVKDVVRDYEDLFGQAGAPDTTTDINLGTNILNLNLSANSLTNGKYYARVRHRDRNLEWSAWSNVDSFVVVGSSASITSLSTNQQNYLLSDTVKVTYQNGPGNSNDWIGIYKLGDVPNTNTSTLWQYTNGTSGVVNFTGLASNVYYAAYFQNNGYTEIAQRDTFFVGTIPVLTTSKFNYSVTTTDTVKVSFTNAPNFTNDWIGIYKMGQTPGSGTPSLKWSYAGGTNGMEKHTGFGKGYYFASYFIKDGYYEPASRVYFSVGDTITQLTINKSIYSPGEYLSSFWTDGPGNPKDWLGVYDSISNPNINPLIKYSYIGGQAQGNLADTLVPNIPGNYFIVLFTNDSYNEVSNRVYFKVSIVTKAGETEADKDEISLFPNPTSNRAIIESKYPIDNIEILNDIGQTVFKSVNVNAQHYSFLCHELPPGTYFVKVLIDNRKMFTYKLAVTKG